MGRVLDANIKMALAPMEGVTVFPMRLWLHWASRPEAMTTPFLRATRVFPERELPPGFAPELGELRGVLPYELTPQILSAERDAFLRAAELLPPEIAPVIDFNCGCPSPNSAGKDAGSGILRDPDRFGERVASLVAALGPGRLAVKMRLGIEDDEEIEALLPHVARLPLARLTVHGRTRKAGYRGVANWRAIGRAASEGAMPTWASGDVIDRATLAGLTREAPKVAGVMIGRGAMRNPWVFDELRDGAEREPPSREVLMSAVFCFALLTQLWIDHPRKLIARLQSGRLLDVCGTDADAWERATTQLTALVFGVPFVLAGRPRGRSLDVSAQAFQRVRYLWSFLGTSARRARNFEDLLNGSEQGDDGRRLHEGASSGARGDDDATS